MKKTLLLLVLSLLLLPLCAYAAEYTYGGLIVTSDGTPGTDFAYVSGAVQVKTSRPITIRNVNPNSQTGSSISAAAGVDVDITLAGVNINAKAPVYVGDAKSAKITLAAGTTNKLYANTWNYAALDNGVTPLIIQGEGRLEATARIEAAGIGSGIRFGKTDAMTAGNITIKSGTIIAKSLADGSGAGIGASEYGNAENIIIEGGYIEASGHGAGIGAGDRSVANNYGGNVKNIQILGGTVIATCNDSGAAIGGGTGKTLADGIIIGPNATVTTTSRQGAGIGGGLGGDAQNIVISGKVNITTNSDGAGIGGGGVYTVNADVIYGSAKNIRITGSAEVDIITKGGAGIGGGGATYNASKSHGTGRDITIEENAVVNITVNGTSAGIGGGTNGNGENITIRDNAKVTVTANGGGAGIGGGHAGHGDRLRVEGGTVLLQTGGTEKTPDVCGPALGNGYLGEGKSDIQVSGGYLEAAVHGTASSAASSPVRFAGYADANETDSEPGYTLYRSAKNDTYHWLRYPSENPPVVPGTGDSFHPVLLLLLAGCSVWLVLAILRGRRRA